MAQKPKHPQDDGKPYVCQDTPDLFAPRLKRKHIRVEASKKAWRTRKRLAVSRRKERAPEG